MATDTQKTEDSPSADGGCSCRLVALLGGGDWADASVEHLVVPCDVDIEAQKQKYRDWLKEFWRLMDSPERIGFQSFSRWLILNRGAREATSEEIEIIEDA